MRLSEMNDTFQKNERRKLMAIKAVFFDVGETLVDETRQWGGWADWLGVPRLTFFAALGAVIERGHHHRGVFELARPGLELAREQAARAAAGQADLFDRGDFYPAPPDVATRPACSLKTSLRPRYLTSPADGTAPHSSRAPWTRLS